MIKMDPKRIFFDSPAITDHMDKVTQGVFKRFGQYTRKVAMNSIVKAPFTTRKPRGKMRLNFRRQTSQPGKPPFSRKGLLKKHIYFHYDTQTESVIIGAAELARTIGDAPHALEWGGMSVRKIKPRRGRRGRKKPVRIKARPFMRPAFEIGKKKLTALWAGTKLSKV